MLQGIQCKHKYDALCGLCNCNDRRGALSGESRAGKCRQSNFEMYTIVGLLHQSIHGIADMMSISRSMTPKPLSEGLLAQLQARPRTAGHTAARRHPLPACSIRTTGLCSRPQVATKASKGVGDAHHKSSMKQALLRIDV